MYVLHQLRAGYSVLLTDVDNIFVRYLDTAELEESGYDVYHAYCHNFPVRFLSMGFTVCGGMVWLKGNTISEKKRDGPGTGGTVCFEYFTAMPMVWTRLESSCGE